MSLQRWMAGQAQPEGMPSHADWVAGIAAALDHVRTQHAGDVLLVSSGGPIATAVGQVAEADAEASVSVAMAAAHSCGAAVEVVGRALQLHGGIGYTWESGIHTYLKRAALNRSLHGSPAAHRRRLAARYL